MRITQLAISGLLLIFFLTGCGFMNFNADSKPKKETNTTNNYQQTGCITLYEHIHFQGKSKKICTSHSDISHDFNDLTSSFKADCSVASFTLYEHIHYKGRALSFKGCSEISNINQVDHTFNDIVSSITMKQ